MDTTPYRLAYDASVRAIEDQARVLEELRSRSGTLVAAAALVTGFLGDQALGRSPEIEPSSLEGAAIASFVLTAAAAFVILWPFRLRFSVSAGEMLEIIDERADTDAVGAIEAHREVALRLERMYDRNADRIQSLLWAFRCAIVLLAVEVAAWAAALWRL